MIKKLFALVFGLILFGCSESSKEQTDSDMSELKEPIKEKKQNNREDTIKFWRLIAQQKIDESISFANSLVKENSGQVHDFYKNLFKTENIKFSVIERREFNKVDAFFWSQAQILKSIVNEALMASKDLDSVKVIYDKVVNQVKSEAEAQDISSYPLHIWQRGFGACDRQSWVFCELVYQMGGQSSVIYLRNPKTLISPHTICEVVFNNRHYVVDILNQKLLADTKYTDLTTEKIKEIWKEKPELHNTFEKHVRLIPAMPIDYSERNQRLNARLGQLIRFGEPPQNRFHFWKKIYPKEDIRFWGYAIRILQHANFYKNEEK